MKRALIIGGDGYVGSRLAQRLVQDNRWDVSVLTLPSHRDHNDAKANGIRRFFGDRRNPSVLRSVLAAEPDVVYDLISYGPAETEALVREAKGRIGRLVHLSTVSVYCEYPGRDRATERNARRFEQLAPGYGPQKAACERVLERSAEDGFPHVILRAAPIMGPGDPCSRENYFAKRILSGQPIIHPGRQEGFLWLLLVDDLIDAAVRAATAPVLGRVFHLAHADAPTLRGHVDALSRRLGMRPPELWTRSPERLTQEGFWLYGFPYALTIPVPPDITAAVVDLNWRPLPYQGALAAAVACTGEQKGLRSSSAWPGRDTTQARLSGTHEWLHSALESQVLAGLRNEPGPDHETLLGWLSGEVVKTGVPQFVEAEEWPSIVADHSISRTRTGDLASDSVSQFVSVPRELMEQLATSGRQLGRRTYSHTARMTSRVQPRLVAAIELDRWEPGRAWIYGSSRPPEIPHYGVSSHPQRVDIVPAGIAVSWKPGSGERLLIETRSADDATVIDSHLRGCQKRGWLLVSDIAMWARSFW